MNSPLAMFNNIRAFIRHGKQANNMKAQAELDAELNSGPEPTLHSDLTLGNSSILPSDLEAMLNEIPETEDRLGAFENDDRINRNRDHNAHTQGQYANNYDIASHMVEEERREKQKKTQKYPNLDHYEVLEMMGEGAFSVVFKARHLATRNLVAIKILRKYQMDSAQKQAVLKEVIIMRQLNHPKVVKFIEFVESEPYYYIVQELVAGGEIFTAIVNYTYFSEDLARHVVHQVGQLVRYLHEEVGIVHRDIKPENLLFEPIEFRPSLNPIAKLRRSDDPKTKKDEGEFTPGIGGGTIGVVKLADFGLSKQIWDYNTKTPCGTVGYTAPEIVRDERYSKEVDMWAIGCVLYTLLCGFPPFFDERIEALTEKVARGEYTFLAPWWDEISNDAKYCVSRLLTVDPKQRYTIDQFLDDPWVRKGAVFRQPEPRKPIGLPRVQSSQKFSRRYQETDLYSPAATALREAFDVSAAVHRMGEEAALQKNARSDIPDVVEEDEELDDSSTPTAMIPRQMRKEIIPHAIFDLNLRDASILERRKNKATTMAVST